MIRSIGIDSVEIERFQNWHTYSKKQLKRVFHPTEIEYCLSCPSKSAERFAARFAAKEAFFKALSSAYPDICAPFLTICRAVQVTKQKNGAPLLDINWTILAPFDITESERPLISITHSQTIATAFVVMPQLQFLSYSHTQLP